MINYFNFKEYDDCYLITNELGLSCFLTKSDFNLLVDDKLTDKNPKYQELYEKFFVYHERKEVFIDRIHEHLRCSKNYLFSATSLFIFVVTNLCNADCIYCQAQDSSSICRGKMDLETARKSVEIAMTSPNRYLSFEFQGGEPLLNFEIIKFIVEYSNELKLQFDKIIEYSVVSNLTLLTDEMIDFFSKNNVSVSTSLDGNEEMHNLNRPLKSGAKPFYDVVKGYYKLKERDIVVGAIETTTKNTLNKYKELIDTYVDLGLESVFIRPLTPLGIAKENWERIGYSAEDFIDFYKKSIEYLIELNEKGIFIREGHANIFLQKIINGESINYMELRSPCGASIGQMAFYYDGKIFTCDEGRMLSEMGNNAFQLGDVNNTFEELINNPVCKSACASSILEAIPDCCDCVYSPFCGTCPVINLALDGDIFPNQAKNYRCKIYSGMLDTLFDYFKNNNEKAISVLKSWVDN